MTEHPDFSGVPEDIQRLVAAHHAQYGEAVERGDAAERVQHEWARSGGASATSPRGEVTVRVSAAGLLEDVRIQQRGLDVGARGLSHLLTTTLRQALLTLQDSIAKSTAEAEAGAVGAAMLAEVRAGLTGPLSELSAHEGEIRDR